MNRRAGILALVALIAVPFTAVAKIGFVISLKTARGLGIVIPQSLLVRADEVIE